MRSKAVLVCMVGLVAVMLLPAAYAQDGPPNLGTAQIGQVDARWFIDARVYEVDSALGHWNDNTTLSFGFRSPINIKTEFSLMYSEFSNVGADPINTALRRSEREVIAPSIKRRISGQGGNSVLSVSIGADIATKTATGTNVSTGHTAFQDDFTPAAKVQLEWGQPGNMQCQLAAQIAFWDNFCATTLGTTIPGFGTVYTAGGGMSIPFSSNLTLVGDVMTPISSFNVINSTTNMPDNQLIWSAGGTWALGGPARHNLSIYATNSIGPTLGTSIIGAPDNSVGFGVTYRRDL